MEMMVRMLMREMMERRERMAMTGRERMAKNMRMARMEMMSEQEKLMFQLVHHRKWKEVVSLYEEYPELQGKPLTATNETTLHMAIMAGNKNAVTMLLNVLKNAVTRLAVRRILTIGNDDGVTPIQLAAKLDMDEACLEMVRLFPDLVTEMRNKDGETLLFEAVREGKKELFFALELLVQYSLPNPLRDMVARDVTHCRRNDGNNILHIAIDGEYFDLAYEIVYLYPRMVNYVNERGESPLHSLANKPSSFKSGTSFNLFDQVIYYRISIEPIKTNFHKYKSSIIGGECSKKKQAKNDEENPVSGGGQQESSEEEKKCLPFQKINDVGVDLFNRVMKILLVISLVSKTQTLEKMKRKHNHACQLMNQLIQRSEAWEHDKNDGMNPHISRPTSGSYASPSKAPEAETFADSVAPPKEPPIDDSSSSNDADASHTGVQWDIFRVIQMLKKEKIIYREVDEPKEEEINKPDKATPALVAAKNGITEMVSKILETFPVALLDLDKNEKNIVLLAVEYRQMHMYEFMNDRNIMNDSVFRKVDKNGNSALHLAAKLSLQKLPWDLGGAALRMQWDVKWYKYVMNSKDTQFFATWNCGGKTAQQIFSEEHKDLLKDAGKWMQDTSQSFSVVATLIASVAFASATTVPGGTNQDSGLPILSGEFPFKVFTVSAFIAFCFSVASLLTFLNIITSPHRAEDFEKSLPGKLLIGLTSLFTAIAAMLVAFCAGNLLAMEKKPQNIALAIYAITCFLVLIFALVELPLYVYLFKATLNNSPAKVTQTSLNTF